MSATPVHIISPSVSEGLGHGQKDVTLAGTAVPLSSTSVPCTEVLIQAKRGNGGRIYFGGASVANNDSAGAYLTAGQTSTISTTNLNKVYINSTVNAEGVTYVYQIP